MSLVALEATLTTEALNLPLAMIFKVIYHGILNSLSLDTQT